MKKFIFSLVLLILIAVVLGSCGKQATKVSEVSRESVEPEIPKVEKSKAPAAPEPIQEKEKAAPKVAINFRNVNFDFDKYELRADARDILAGHAQVLKENPDIKLTIEGHCDERGTIEYNLALGERRANAVKNYLINYGINPKRLSTISYGKERPLDPRSNEEAWAKNRRAAFVINKS